MSDNYSVQTHVPFNQLSDIAPLNICSLDSWSLTSLTGEDRSSYLNGQVTIDTENLAVGSSSLGAHCDAKGKMYSAFRLFTLADELVLAQKKSTEEIQLVALKKYAVFSKVTISVSKEWKLYGIAGEDAQQWVAQHYGDEAASAESSLVNDSIIVNVGANDNAKRYLLLTKETIDSNAPESIWSALDIAAGIPQLEFDTQGIFIPQMLNLQLLDAINFSKGCYIGQETIARAKYRGTNKRATYLLTGESAFLPIPGDVIEQQLESGNWRKAGTVLQAVKYQDKHIELLAVLANDLASDCQLRLQEDEISEYQFSPQPYALD